MGILTYNSPWEARDTDDTEETNCQTHLVYTDPVAFDRSGKFAGADYAQSLIAFGH